ncbi:hypothetical protein LY78DRAFT_304832 [Colletotrichum sublineola]|nr:hypothetical protein LY78DRAFT_304832 [Colletotrichum sublineola]
MLNTVQLLHDLERVSLWFFCGGAGPNGGQVLAMLASAREELRRGAFHAMFISVGQYPRPQSSPAQRSFRIAMLYMDKRLRVRNKSNGSSSLVGG